MPYHFEVDLKANARTVSGMATPTQWEDEAVMFEKAAENILRLHAIGRTEITSNLNNTYSAARLYEYAAIAFEHAARLKPMGHNRADRYNERARVCRGEAIRLYQRYKGLVGGAGSIPVWAN